MAQQRATGPRAAAKRELLLDAAEKVMIEIGYAGVTSRSVAAEAQVPAPLVHYYFATLDDLFIALLQRGVERSTEQFIEALSGPEPLRAVWELNLRPKGTSLTTELVALSRHRPAVQSALAEISGDFQERQIEALAEVFDRTGVDADTFPPELAVLAIGGLARVIVRERAMGVTTGHEVALQAIDRLIDGLQKNTPAQRRRRRR
jgi:AcrR family transcriptional regulator